MQDITCWRTDDGTVECSIPQRHRHHSSTGFEIGAGGSGPADLALNILAIAIGDPPDCGPQPEIAEPEADDPFSWAPWEAAWRDWTACDAQRVQLWDDTYVHRDVWELHNAFTWQFIATMPREGGTIPGVVIEAWVTANRHQLTAQDAGVE